MLNHRQTAAAPRSTAQIMRWVLLGLLPAITSQLFYFGWGILLQLLLASGSALLFEAAVLWLRRRPLRPTLGDGSALLTGVLLALTLPPLAPWWLAVIGSLWAIVIAKQLYGGLGHNLFNPAMVGYVVLLVAFPQPMSAWPPSIALLGQRPTWAYSCARVFQRPAAQSTATNSDAVTQATPLDRLKNQARLPAALRGPAALDSAWYALNLSALFGGLLLWARGILQGSIPGMLLISFFCSATLGWCWEPLASGSPLQQLCGGATMLGAFFIATDPVTAATTRRGRLLFGALIGVLLYLIRRFSDYPDGLAFAVLIANMLVPWLDHRTQPRVYGAPPP